MLGLGNYGEIAAGVARGALVSFAGLELELEGERRSCERVARVARGDRPSALEAEPGTGWSRVSHIAGPKFSRGCLLHVQPRASAPSTSPGTLAWQCTPDGGTLATRFVHAELEHVVGRWVARAWLDDDARAPHELLNALAVVLVHRLGGAVLHAASVEVEGMAIAFVGPSGAGKSTACRHMGHAPLFSVDRLAVLPGADGGPGQPRTWFSHPLSGGTRPFPHMPSARPRWLPLSCVLAVQRSADEATIVTPSRAGAVRLLRESTFQAGLAPAAEHELLASLEELAARVPVGRLHWGLGASLKTVSSRWLMGQAEGRT